MQINFLVDHLCFMAKTGGKIHFDYEGDMVDKCPTIEAVPIEELKHLRDELYEQDLISMEGLKQLNMLIGKYTIRQG